MIKDTIENKEKKKKKLVEMKTKINEESELNFLMASITSNKRANPSKSTKRKGKTASGTSKNVITSADGVTPIDDLVFEDPYEDEWGSSSDEDEESNNKTTAKTNQDTDGDVDMSSSVPLNEQDQSNSSSSNSSTDNKPSIWRGNIDDLEPGEKLDFDESTYITYHAMRTQWPCLSFDVIRDRLGNGRTKFPMTSYLVAGTQADRADRNEVLVMKVGDLHKTMRENLEEDDSDDDLDDDPYLLTQSLPHVGGVNRIRSMPQASNVVATWSETSDIHIFDVSSQLAQLDISSGSADGSGGGSGGASSGFSNATNSGNSKDPVFTYTGHQEEGYAMAWSNVKAGRLATGDCASNIHVWDVVTGTKTWSVDASPYQGHTSSIEDLQWSNTEENVFASCSADCSVRIFDVRRKNASMLCVNNAHTQDVNVLSWNPLVGFLLASGSDDGSFKIWDLRKFQADSPVAHFQFHRAPITSIEWSGSEDSILATSSADHTCCVWDMSLEVRRKMTRVLV